MSDLANSSSIQISFIKEDAFGVTPTAGNATKLQVTGEGFDFKVAKETSKAINNSRTVSGTAIVGASSPGSFTAEMSYREYDPIIEATLQSTWVVHGTDGVSTAVVEIDFAATTLTASVAPAGADLWTNLHCGQWFRVTAPTNPNDGKLLRIHPITAPTATVITLDPNTPAVVSADVVNCRLSSSRLTHGNTQPSFSVERASEDIAQFFCYSGQTPGKFTIDLATSGLTTCSFEFIGKAAKRDVVTMMPGTPVESQNFDIHSHVSGPVSHLWEGGAPVTGTFVKKIGMVFDNVLRVRDGLGVLGAASVGAGTISLTGTMLVYFANGDLFDKYKNNSKSSIIFTTLDPDGNGYVITIPAITLNDYKSNATGKDQDMMVEIQFTAERDATNAVAGLRKAVFIDRVGTIRS